MNDHTCPVAGCTVVVPHGKLMCLAHWRRVPRHLREQVMVDWRDGQPRVNYLHTRADAIAVVNRILLSERT